MSRIDKDDLEADPVVRLQHKYYIPIALFFGLVAPTIIAGLWGDKIGGFIYGGILARILIWHCTFMINSLAHWEGLQPYTDEVTARGNLHAFPHDFRNGPRLQDWDPSKWIIWVLHRFTPLVTRVRQARDEDVTRAQKWMAYIHAQGKDHLPYGWEDLDDDVLVTGDKPPESQVQPLENWDRARLEAYIQKKRRVIVLIDRWVVDITDYMKEHPGGSAMLRDYSYRPLETKNTDNTALDNASWAFNGGMNSHTRTARARMRSLRIARFVEDED
ncbi:hypothetical protein FRC09_013515 [Ceratobasidium sp. 395]|nr:hypothetical protein FRC09_013515 [Ceratobasidium sp. 395]